MVPCEHRTLQGLCAAEVVVGRIPSGNIALTNGKATLCAAKTLKNAET
jgi:hypothetical protein